MPDKTIAEILRSDGFETDVRENGDVHSAKLVDHGVVSINLAGHADPILLQLFLNMLKAIELVPLRTREVWYMALDIEYICFDYIYRPSFFAKFRDEIKMLGLFLTCIMTDVVILFTCVQRGISESIGTEFFLLGWDLLFLAIVAIFFFEYDKLQKSILKQEKGAIDQIVLAATAIPNRKDPK